MVIPTKLVIPFNSPMVILTELVIPFNSPMATIVHVCNKPELFNINREVILKIYCD